MTKYKFIVYVISGGLAALAGIIAVGRTALGSFLSKLGSKNN